MSSEVNGNGPVHVHATVVVLGETGVLVRGASGSGKSRLAAGLLAEAKQRGLFSQLVGDDRVDLLCQGGRIVARGHPAIAGRMEQRGHGIIAVPFEAACVVSCIVDLSPDRPDRLPNAESARTALLGVWLPRIALQASDFDASGPVLLDRLLVCREVT